MRLQIAQIGLALGQKPTGRQKHHAAAGDTLHIGNKFQSAFFVQMLNDIQSNAGVKLARLKIFLQRSHVARHILIMGVLAFGLFQCWRVAFGTHGVFYPQLSQGMGDT